MQLVPTRFYYVYVALTIWASEQGNAHPTMRTHALGYSLPNQDTLGRAFWLRNAMQALVFLVTVALTSWHLVSGAIGLIL